MNIFTAFSRYAPNAVFLSTLAGIAAGVALSLLIPIVMIAFDNNKNNLPTEKTDPSLVFGFEVLHFKVAILFFSSCLFILITLMRVSMEVTAKMRMDIYRKISRAPIENLESLGSARLIAMITTDVGNIVMGARALPDIMIHSVSVLGVLGFLIYLNHEVFWFVLFVILLGAVSYQIPILISNIFFAKARVGIDRLHEGMRGLIYGAKELKLDIRKRNDYLQGTLEDSERYVLDKDKTASTIVTIAGNYGDLIGFFSIGFIAFIFVNYHSITTTDLVGVTMALLYVTGPVGNIIHSVPQIALAKVSMNKVRESLASLSEEVYSEDCAALDEWKEVKFEDVFYQYQSETQRGFGVGPLNFTIAKGEVTFIIGGNGSGKSTMSKLITLHYRAAKGDIYFGKHRIDSTNLVAARHDISAIYSDYYLFERLLGDVNSNANEIDLMLRELSLDRKVQLKDGNISTLALSDGQRRRLALLISYLEDKQMYLFDEWAADQDPIFKEFFYHTMLPRLRSRDKAVVVISHDDRYFSVADQLIEMEDGKITRITRPKEKPGKAFADKNF